MTLSPPSPSPVDTLIAHLRSLNITDASPTANDAYLPLDAINTALEVLVNDFVMIHGAFAKPETVMYIAPTWASLKMKLVTALCEPYRRAVAGLKIEMEQIRQMNASEISLLRQTSTSEIALLRQANELQASELSRALSRTAADDKELLSLKSRCDELEKSRDYFTSETLRLSAENSDLKSMRVHADGVPATGTRSQTWQQVMDDPNTEMDAILPHLSNPITNQEVEALSATKYVKEPAMYKRVQKCLAEHLDTLRTDAHPGSLLFDSHNIEVIGPFKPDMSLVTAACSVPTVGAMIAAVELKAGKFNKDSFGQLYDYLKGIKAAQPNRRIIIGLLSNLTNNHFLVLECSQQATTRCIHYQSVTLAVALTYLRDVVIPDSVFHPPGSVFTPDLGRMERQLGNPAFSIVGVFPVPPAISTPEFAAARWVDPDFVKPYGKVLMVVKRTTPGVHGAAIKSRAPRTVQNEIQILLKIRELAIADKTARPITLPHIIYHNNSFDEFGMLPRGYPVLPTDGGVKWGKVISDVLDALAWLHARHIIHRDVRLDNVIWNIDHAVLIDLGTAVDLSRYRSTSMCYNGGYVCCPPSIIGNMDTSYEPTAADDCLAVVLLVNTVLFPARWQAFRSVELEKPGSPETRDLGRFWKSVEASPVWSRYWKAARMADYEGLKSMREWFVHL